MNQCTLCNPDNLKRRDEAYRLLEGGCSLASVAQKLDIPYSVLQRCWSEHDQDPIRSMQRRILKAKKRLATAESRHKREKIPTSETRQELKDAQNALLALDKHLVSLKEIDDVSAQKTLSGETVLTLEGVDRLLRSGPPHSSGGHSAKDRLRWAVDFMLSEEMCAQVISFLKANGITIRVASSAMDYYDQRTIHPRIEATNSVTERLPLKN
jgi:hypothetical protein